MRSETASRLTFFGVSALVVASSLALTISWSASMSAMGEMQMPGGWTMSMAWMRMPGQSWMNAAGSFVLMWLVMMVGMMGPSLAPVLCRLRDAGDGRNGWHKGRLTALVALGYFLVWTALGTAAFSAGAAVTTIEMQQPMAARFVPAAIGLIVLMAGALQFTAWKSRHLACCREMPSRVGILPLDAGRAWRHGVRLGIHCTCSCAGLTAILLVFGVMDLWTMGIVTAGITIERFAPSAERAARVIGLVGISAGVLLTAHGLRVVGL
jgi:predicted metal-binding membrane protein